MFLLVVVTLYLNDSSTVMQKRDTIKHLSNTHTVIGLHSVIS